MRGRRWSTVVATIVMLAGALVGIARAERASATVSRASAGVLDASILAGRDLLAYVPTEFRGTCRDSGLVFDDQQFAQAIVTSFSAGVICTTEAGDLVFYTKFADRAGADAYLETLVTVANYTDASAKLSDCPSSTTYTTTHEGKKRRGGRVFCFVATEATGLPVGTPVVQWTDERLGIVAQSYNVDDPEHVHRFFARDAGPLTKPDRAGIPTARTTAAVRSDGTALFDLVPKASRSGCSIVNERTRDALGSLYVWRFWLEADVETCAPEDGPAAVEYVRLGSTGAVDAFYARSGVPNPAQNAQEFHGITCPGSDTYKAGGHRVGAVKCFFANYDTGGNQSADPYFHLEWSSKPTRVVAFAISPAATERTVMDWWADRGGPIVD